MPTAHFRVEVKVGSRSTGASAKAKADYILRHGRDDADLVFSESGNIPQFCNGDAMAFWEAADEKERKNGVLFRESVFSLPSRLSRESQLKIVREYQQRVFPGCPFSFGIHDKDRRNPHCHLMISERPDDGIFRDGDKFFKRYNNENPEQGGTRKLDIASRGKDWLQDARKTLEEIVNRELKAAGLSERVSSASYEKMEGITELQREQLIAKRGRHLGNKVWAKAHKKEYTPLVVRLADDRKRQCYVMRASFTNSAGQKVDYKVADDFGDRLLLANNASKKSCLLVMTEAGRRWPEGCEIFGDDETRMKLAAAAAIAGVRVKNLTLDEQIEYKRYERKQNGGSDIRIPSARPDTARSSIGGHDQAARGRTATGGEANQRPAKGTKGTAADAAKAIRAYEPYGKNQAANLLEDYRAGRAAGIPAAAMNAEALKKQYPLKNIINAHAVGYSVQHHVATRQIAAAHPETKAAIQSEYGRSSAPTSAQRPEDYDRPKM